MAGPALADVPDRYDVVFSLNDGTTYGFLLSDALESNLPFRTHKAAYSYSPTFLERQNVSNQYGDNFQDFFLTGAQDDFSLGEMQKFFRVNDPERSRRYWQGKNVDPSTVPGNVNLTNALASLASSVGTIATASSLANGQGFDWWTADATNLYGVSVSSGTISVTNKGAHGLSSPPVCIGTDPSNVYLSAGLVGGGIKKWNGSTFSTFSALGTASQLVYLNNILYAYQANPDSLVSFDTSGNATTQFQWKNADGANLTGSENTQMVPYGGVIYILRGSNNVFELWKYDGSGCLMQAQFPPDFVGQVITVNSGIVFVSGYVQTKTGKYLPQVYYYVNGSVGKLWESQLAMPGGVTANSIPMCAFGNGVAFKDPSTNNIYQYDISLGGVHCIANFANTNAVVMVGSNSHSAFLLLYNGTLVTYGGGANYNSSGFIQTSQYDFDNTLNKVFRGVKVDADIPANTSVDIAYQIDGVTGSYVSLQTGITSGQEYLLPANTNGHSISLQVTLNSATGSATPTVKRVYVRAAPTLQQFRRAEYIFDLTGGYREDLGKTSRVDRDGYPYSQAALTAAKNLIKIATQTIPFTVSDRFTTPNGYTALADLQENAAGFDGFAIYEIKPGTYLARINLREV